ncbi:polyunsaturated fatty acid lipoxygenase ALOX15B isoform X1 [Tachysurus ichikawai]
MGEFIYFLWFYRELTPYAAILTMFRPEVNRQIFDICPLIFHHQVSHAITSIPFDSILLKLYDISPGFPQTFQTKAELTKYITMVIFTSSALHSAVNFSQLDFNLWMPNCPAAMLRPPPQVKGSVTEEDILTFLPDVNTTCRVLIVLFLLSQPSVDYVPLCQYREWYFSNGAPNKLVEMVQQDLSDIAHDIRKRNSKLELAYPYLQPDNIENSVSI